MSDAVPRLRVGVIGLGVGEQHVKAFRVNPHCEIAAICDRSPEKQLRARELYPEAVVITEAADVLADPSIDIVSVASFDDDHFDQVTGALRAGKHVFVEKPLCQTVDQLREIKRIWVATGAAGEPRKALRSNLVLRGAPLYRWLRERVRAGALGEIYSFDGDYLYGRLPKITEGWRAAVPDYSVMAGGGVHLIDLLGWVVGQRPSRLSARGNRICSQGTLFRYDDFVAVTLEYDSGLIARITANFGCVHGHQHVVRAFGTQGTFVYDDQGPRLQTHRDPAPPAQRIEEAPLPPSKGVLIDDFVHSILSGVGEDEETQADFDTVSICFACDAALRSQTTVEVEYV